MLRHACGYKLANQGVDTRSLQHYLGHKNIQHTVRYSELSRFLEGLSEGGDHAVGAITIRVQVRPVTSRTLLLGGFPRLSDNVRQVECWFSQKRGASKSKLRQVQSSPSSRRPTTSSAEQLPRPSPKASRA
jgi:hypothetical protein